ncbi:MAG: Ribosome-recycling factor [Candidatus Wolfebacteria bacterium GW2011_GWC1_43_10]|uniref:Ribosome-recycling factor n=2 Tax=Candidatus Wolfeibacteriota TaxID=1752735 RepID=A0A0G1CC43_9BACT|nr:MAG: Ribosome-recycling factor [Candidatus Wolfebacteria bacterium GW2011_GWC1_43_10]KKT22723.1 MAG: Ribosome-recycling factor [Parcubacteria group bacterium GW2011_GWB1_43_8b]OGM90058.1 MAG: hypothetical protein A2108_01830 [Candidatus Wolfebacteria bacterium GWA1_42_9]
MSSEIEQKFTLALEGVKRTFREEMSSVRSNRPTPALVEDIAVDYYGQKVPIKQVGSINVIPPREIQISVWDKAAVSGIVKAISAALNLQGTPDGNVIHINLPSLTQERKDELIRLIKGKTEETKIKSRTLRDEAKKEIGDKEKSGEITEDDRFQLNEKLQKLIDKFNEEIDEQLDRKIKEISE